MSNENAKKHDWGMFFVGIALVICAIIMLVMPGITLVSIALMAGIMLLFAGGADLSAFFSAKGTAGRGWILLNAVIDIILGIMFVVHPVAAAAVLPWVAGCFIIAYGVAAIVSAFGLRKLGGTWGLMILNGILSIIVGVLFFVDPASFVAFLSAFLIMRGILMCVYGMVSPRSIQ